MGKKSSLRKRCSECRDWYHPSGSAQQHQRVCGQQCRKVRRRRLARLLRRRAVQEHRVAERERQRLCRRRRREGSVVPVGGQGDGPTIAPCQDPTEAGEERAARSVGRSGGREQLEPADTPCHGPASSRGHEPDVFSGHERARGGDRDQAEVPGRGCHELPCHGPALVWNESKLQEKVLEIVDTVTALSRATLEREIPALMRACGSIAGTSGTTNPGCHAPPAFFK
jgi:hypothetical protein